MTMHGFAPMRREFIPPDPEARLQSESMDFRCERCGIRGWTKDQLTIEPYTNLRVCPNHTLLYNLDSERILDAANSVEVAALYAKYQRLIASDSALYARGKVRSLFADMEGITSWTITGNLHRGGAGAGLTFYGIGFTGSEVITFDTTHITATAPVVTFGGTQMDTTLSADGSAPFGPHELIMDDIRKDIQAVVVP